MSRIVKRVALAAGGVLALLVIAVIAAVGYTAYLRHVNVDRFSIRTPNGINESSYVTVGGIPQWITIRGKDRNNPVLLCVHGGPGGTWSPLTALFLDWENDFTVVQWDERGAGKTYEKSGASASTMTIDTMSQDGVEVAEYLRSHLHKNRIVLLGHSFGSILAVNMMKRRPDLFSAYVGTGQVASFRDDMRVAYTDVLAKAKTANDEKTVAALEKVGTPPWNNNSFATSFGTFVQAASKYGPASEQKMLPTLLAGYFNPDISLGDMNARQIAFQTTPVPLYREIAHVDLTKVERSFPVPVFFFQGADDDVTPASVAKAYFDEISAPHKEFVFLPGGGHFAVWMMHERFGQELAKRVRPLIRS